MIPHDPVYDELSKAMREFFATATANEVQDLLNRANYDVLKYVDGPVCAFTQAFLPFVSSIAPGLDAWSLPGETSNPSMESLERILSYAGANHELALAA